MKIDENFLFKKTNRMMNIFISHLFSPGGRAGDLHMPRCQGFEVKNYDFTLGRLAYKSLRLVQDPRIPGSYMKYLVGNSAF